MRAHMCQPLSWEGTVGDNIIKKIEPFPPEVDGSKLHAPSIPTPKESVLLVLSYFLCNCFLT